MATINTLVTQLIAKTENFIGPMNAAAGTVQRMQSYITGLDNRLSKFSKSFVGKALVTATSISTLDKSLRLVGGELQNIQRGGFNAADSFQRLGTATDEFLRTIPVVGAAGGILADLFTVKFFDAAVFDNALARERDMIAALEARNAAALKAAAGAKALAAAESAIAGNAGGLEGKIAAIEQRYLALANALSVTELRGAAFTEMLDRLQAAQARDEQAVRDSAISRIISDLERQIIVMEQGAFAADLFAASVDGVTRSLVEQAQALRATLDEMERQADLMREGQRITDSVRTAQELYNDTIAHLQELLEAGAISEETFRRAVEQAQDALERQADVEDKVDAKRPASEFHSPAAIERRFAQGMPTGRAAVAPELKLQKSNEQILFEAKKQTSLAERSERNLRLLVEKTPEFQILPLF